MQRRKGMEKRQERKHFKFIKNKRPSMVDMAKVRTGGLDQRHLHTTGSTNQGWSHRGAGKGLSPPLMNLFLYGKISLKQLI
jgi:hypothetical protein